MLLAWRRDYYLFVMLRAVERVCFITVTPYLDSPRALDRHRVVVSGKELCGPKDRGYKGNE